jgi:hypothetical protein
MCSSKLGECRVAGDAVGVAGPKMRRGTAGDAASSQGRTGRREAARTVGDAAGGARREWTNKAWGQESL